MMTGRCRRPKTNDRTKELAQGLDGTVCCLYKNGNVFCCMPLLNGNNIP